MKLEERRTFTIFFNALIDEEDEEVGVLEAESKMSSSTMSLAAVSKNLSIAFLLKDLKSGHCRGRPAGKAVSAEEEEVEVEGEAIGF